MKAKVDIVGAGLAGSEAALQLAQKGYRVRLFEMRPFVSTGVHVGSQCAELVCSNSLKSLKPDSAAGMLKYELKALGSHLICHAFDVSVPAGGALAVDREAFSFRVSGEIENNEYIERFNAEVCDITPEGFLVVRTPQDTCEHALSEKADAIIIASGPLTSDAFAQNLMRITGEQQLSFYDAAAPIVYTDSLDFNRVFSQSRYEFGEGGDYLNAPMNEEEYSSFIDELINAECVIKKDFETKDLFQACQPIEEIARKGKDAPRFGPLKPVGLIDPATGYRPWAVVQLRAEDKNCQSYNLVGFQTNLTFPEQCRVFRMIPGLEHAEFARYGVMHRNTFINAPLLLDPDLRLKTSYCSIPMYIAGQLSGTEGYCEAIAGGLVAARGVEAFLSGKSFNPLPVETALGSLLAYATNPDTCDYQPMHVNFGIAKPLESKIRNKKQRYAAYAERGKKAIDAYVHE